MQITRTTQFHVPLLLEFSNEIAHTISKPEIHEASKLRIQDTLVLERHRGRESFQVPPKRLLESPLQLEIKLFFLSGTPHTFARGTYHLYQLYD